MRTLELRAETAPRYTVAEEGKNRITAVVSCELLDFSCKGENKMGERRQEKKEKIKRGPTWKALPVKVNIQHEL